MMTGFGEALATGLAVAGAPEGDGPPPTVVAAPQAVRTAARTRQRLAPIQRFKFIPARFRARTYNFSCRLPNRRKEDRYFVR